MTGTVADNGTSNDTTLTLAGTAEAGSTVTIYDTDGTTVLGSGVATGGAFTITTSALSQGSHTLTAKATDAAGNQSGSSTAFHVTIDTAPPAAPSIATVADNVLPVTGTVADNGTSNDTTLTLAGTAEAGSTVTIYDTDGTTVLGSGVATGGAFTITTSALSQGSHTLTAKVTDAAGNQSGSSTAFHVTIDTAPPAAGTLSFSGLTDTGSSNTPPVTTDNTFNLSLTGNDAGTVVVYEVSTNGGLTWASTTAAQTALADGDYLFRAVVTDAAGNSSTTTAIEVRIDTAPPATPSITGVTDNVLPVTGTVADNGTSNDTTLTLAGTAEAGSTVTIYDTDGTTVLGSGVATGGAFTITTSALSQGSHTLTAKATDAAGNQSGSSTAFHVTIDTAPPAAPSIATVADNVLPVTGTVADNGTSNDTTLTLAGTAEAGSTVTIYDTDGTTVLGSGVATGGAFTITTSALSQGSHTLTAKVTDAAGNQSGSSTAFHVTIDTAPPVIAESDAAFAMFAGQIGVQQGTFHATDANNDPLTWSIVGGSPVNADYYVSLDDLSIIKNGSQIFRDGFDGGGPPPSAPYFSNGNSTFYFTDGTFVEDINSGRLIMVGRNASAPFDSLTGGQAVHSAALLNSNTQPISTSELGLKSDANFTVAARFDLSLPEDPGEYYGIRLIDSIGDPVLGVHDNDYVGVVVRRPIDGGPVEVELIHIDRQAGTFSVLEAHQLNVPPGVDQIVLRLSHDPADPGGSNVVRAAFDLLDGGVVVGTTIFATSDTIFNGEDWTRAQIVATAPVESDSVYVSDYGVLYVDQDGNWQYNLRNGAPALVQLAQGQSIVDHFTVQVSDGLGGTTSRNIDVTVNGVNDPPTINGDLGISVNKGGSVVLTTADFYAVDPDNGTIANNLTFTVSAETNGHIEVNGVADTTFTQQQLIDGVVTFFHDDSATTQATFKVSVSDGSASSAATTIIAAVPTVTFNVLTAAGFDFQQGKSITEMGAGAIQSSPGPTSTQFTIVSSNYKYVLDGTNFIFIGTTDVTGGIITAIHVFALDDTPLFDMTGRIDAATWYDAVVAAAAGNNDQIDTLTNGWSFNFIGGIGPDRGIAGDSNDFFQNSAGDDFYDGQFGYDRVNFSHATGPINVQLASGSVTGNASVGIDTLRSIEFVTGTNYADTFNATDFSKDSTNSGSTVTFNINGTLNEFEGRGGNDTIIGNGDTRISYLHATAGVTVDFALGTADGDASVGHDTFSGVNRVRGSYFDDLLYGSNNPSNTHEDFEGRGGNDYIDGRGGFDRAVYGNEDTTGISVNLAAGTVVGGPNTGTDTLRSIEGIGGTDFADIFDATGFTASSTNAGSAGVNGSGNAFNEFEGRGGNDTITGNGNTRVAFYNAAAGVTVVLGAGGSGKSYGTAPDNPAGLASEPIDLAGVGTDTFVSGVSRVRGSEFGDIIVGNGGNNTFEGQGGNDVLNGHGGNDTLTGGTGSDIFTFEVLPTSSDFNSPPSNNDSITDFSHSDADRIDLRGIAGINSFDDVLTHVLGSPNTINFDADNSLTLSIAVSSLQASDFIFTGQVGISVQTPDGYDFGTLYDDMAGSIGAIVTVDGNHFAATNAAKGLVFDITVSGDTTPGNPLTGTVNAIDIYDLSGHMLVTSNGWSFLASDLNAALQAYAGDPAQTSGLDAIFATVTYNAVGNFVSNYDFNSSSVNFGGDTFISGAGDDIFNGLTNAHGDFGYSDTVDYSHAPAGVTVNLSLQGAPQNTIGAGWDTLINIENLRGSAGNDTLTGDNLTGNVLEGGPGDDTLNGGGGNNTANYEHAPAGAATEAPVGSGYFGVTVDLTDPNPQDTIQAGTDTLTDIQNLRGSAYDDTLTGNGNSVLEGGPGADQLIGQLGGSDTASYEHAAAGVTASLNDPGSNFGDAAGDTYTNIANLLGSNFNDILIGDNFANVLNGNGTRDGGDTLTGNGGADTFAFEGGRVTVTDFSHTDGDLIDLSPAVFGNGLSLSQQQDALSALLAASSGDTIAFSDGQVLTLMNVDVHSLSISDFILHS